MSFGKFRGASKSLTEVIIRSDPLLTVMVFGKWGLPCAENIRNHENGHFIKTTVIGNLRTDEFFVGPLKASEVENYLDLIKQIDGRVIKSHT